MIWILIALSAPLLYSLANIFDNYLSNKVFSNVGTLIFFSSCFNIVFLPLALFIEVPGLPPLHLLPYILLISIIEVFYLYPYYKALRHDDTSIITSLFALGKIFVPIFAYFIVGETLAPIQYVGFIIIVVSSALLSLKRATGIRVNVSFYYMLACSAMLALETVLYKYIFTETTWSTGFVWPVIFTVPIGSVLLLSPKIRRDIVAKFGNFKKALPIFGIEELLTFGAATASTYAISLVPVTLEKSIEAFQPMFALALALILGRFYPTLVKEQVDRGSIIKKAILFSVMIVGVVLVL